MKINKYITSVLILAAVAGSGCRKYLDVNQNPNVANEATVNLLLPSAEVTIANAVSVNFGIYGGIWGQYWTQSPNSSQYRQLERYQPTAPDFDRAWTNLYAGAGTDLKRIERIGQTSGQTQYIAIAKLLRAYMFQMITDAWGDIPYSEALRGEPQDGGIVAPRYDLQRTVYMGIIQLADSGLALIDPSAASIPGTDDLIYGGDMVKWQRFGNTLKLRMYMRLSQIDPATASAGIQSLQNADFLGVEADDDADIVYTSTSGNQNPLYNEAVGLNKVQNLIASKTVLDSFVSNNDPRVGVFFDSTSSGDYIGITQGDFNTSASLSDLSFPSARVGGNVNDPKSATAPVKLLTGYESLFLQAEAVARGWLPGGASGARNLFEVAIRRNFTTWGLSEDTADYYIANSYWGTFPSGGSPEAQIRHIITQKWFSMCGNQNFEGWTEWRRTGYPDFFVRSATAQINSFPIRFLYPDVEVTRNPNFPGTKTVAERVYWDVQ